MASAWDVVERGTGQPPAKSHSWTESLAVTALTGPVIGPVPGAVYPSERRRPSYLIEMDDIFADGCKVAPAVIGEDPPGQGGSR